MQTYLVGGALRDQLLGLKVQDKDWLVVGATPEHMLELKYQQVGRDFPVFLHPQTHEEYALARTERKSGRGYLGFTCYTSPNVTLEEDLSRRDLTINAMAMDKEGHIHDPFHGQQDLKNKVLRHISPAFIEDPLRVLRVARFAARFAHLGFSIAPETQALMVQIATSGELDHLTAERIWQEWQKSLTYTSPEVFIKTLHQCGALRIILPEMASLFEVPEKIKWHPEGNAGEHTLLSIQQIAKLTSDPIVRFATSLHDLGKAHTDPNHWPNHDQHAQLGVTPIQSLCARIKVPKDYKELAVLVCRYHILIHHVAQMTNTEIIDLFDQLDVWRKPQRLNQILQCCIADTKGRLGYDNTTYPQAKILKEKFALAQNVAVKKVVEEGFKGRQIKEELRKRRIQALCL